MGRGLGEATILLPSGEYSTITVKSWEVLDSGALYIVTGAGDHMALSPGRWLEISVTPRGAL